MLLTEGADVIWIQLMLMATDSLWKLSDMQVTAEKELERHWSLLLNVVRSNKWDLIIMF